MKLDTIENKVLLSFSVINFHHFENVNLDFKKTMHMDISIIFLSWKADYWTKDMIYSDH